MPPNDPQREPDKASVDAAYLCMKHGITPLIELTPDQLLRAKMRALKRDRQKLPRALQEDVTRVTGKFIAEQFHGGPSAAADMLALAKMALAYGRRRAVFRKIAGWIGIRLE